MEGRRRVRTFLSGGDADRPPFLPFASGLAAHLGQIDRDTLFADPQVLTQALLEVAAVCNFDTLVLALRPEELVEAVGTGAPAGSPSLPVLQEGLHRLRALLGDGAALAVVLPGPWTLSTTLGLKGTPAEQDELGGSLLDVAQFLQPPVLDVIGVLETEEVSDPVSRTLASALAPLWNAARYYSMPSLFIASRASAEVADIGAHAVAAWEGVTPEELAAAGARRPGVLVPPEAFTGGPGALAPLPSGGFYLTKGEIPEAADVAAVREVTDRATRTLA